MFNFPRWPQRRNKIRERITCVTRGLGVVLAGGTFFGSLIDHSASASHCCKASSSPHRDFRRFLRPHPQRPSFRCASCRPAVQFRRASLHSREPAAAQAEAAPRAVPAPLCDFIIANRPGIRPEALRLVIPPDLIARPDAKKEADQPSQVIAHLHKSTIYLLENVSSEVSATDVRRQAHRGQSIHGLVSARVEEYILKQGLYR